ncbi:MAG: heavy-metal-associated domain-containing protein, partial [Acidimicrobiia bacterium]
MGTLWPSRLTYPLGALNPSGAARQPSEEHEMPVRSYQVPEMSCDHCKNAIEGSLAQVPGVASVAVDLEALLVTVSGDALPEEVRSAIEN